MRKTYMHLGTVMFIGLVMSGCLSEGEGCTKQELCKNNSVMGCVGFDEHQPELDCSTIADATCIEYTTDSGVNLAAC